MKKISIVLLIKNGAKYLPKLIAKLRRQKGDFELELVVVDSGSTDGSRESIKGIKEVRNLGIKVFKIKPDDFGHGRTRNFAVSKCSGEIVVFLSQDAMPVNNEWLTILIEPLFPKRHSGETRSAGRLQNDENKIAGVFGRQIPYPDTNEIEKYFYEFSYPDKTKILEQKDSLNFSNQNLFFSNVNAAARKELLLKYPFRQDLVMSEDQYWGREVLKKDYKIAYEPKASVWHSHNYSLKELCKRYYQSGYSQRQIGLEGKQLTRGAGTFLGLLKYIFLKKTWLFPYAAIYGLVKGGAFATGKLGIFNFRF